MLDPGGGGFGKARFGGGELFEEPIGLIAGLRFALVERLAGVAHGNLRLLECRAELDRERILGDRRLERPRATIVVATLSVAATAVAWATVVVATRTLVAGAAWTIVGAARPIVAAVATVRP